MSSWSKRVSRQGGAFRSLTFAVTWFCLAAQTLGVAHLAVVRHVTCLEHGELTHSGQTSVPTKDATPAPRSLAAPQRADLSAAADNHEHCLVCATRKEFVAERAAQSLALPQRVSSPPVAPPEPGSSQPLFRLAPKTSPPA